MPRLVRLEATASFKIDPATIAPGKMISVCACGLSRTFPLCDGSHKAAREKEKPGVLSVYDKDRLNIIEERPDELP
ncbi:MAG: CDGSH iron-sulfur domain-containing protein [Phycisphaerales bacterium]